MKEPWEVYYEVYRDFYERGEERPEAKAGFEMIHYFRDTQHALPAEPWKAFWEAGRRFDLPKGATGVRFVHVLKTSGLTTFSPKTKG